MKRDAEAWTERRGLQWLRAKFRLLDESALRLRLRRQAGRLDAARRLYLALWIVWGRLHFFDLRRVALGMRAVEDYPLVGVHCIQGRIVGNVAAQIFLCLLEKRDLLCSH